MYKTVLITGASRGIGRAIACAYAREGCRLVINCSRSEKELLALADELREHRRRVRLCLYGTAFFPKRSPLRRR